MSKLVNEYGAFNREFVDVIEDKLRPVYKDLKALCEKMELDPCDTMLLEKYVHDCLSVRFGEDRIRRAMEMRKKERGDLDTTKPIDFDALFDGEKAVIDGLLDKPNDRGYNGYIEAIKYYRNYTGCTLKRGKDVIDAYQEYRKHRDSQRLHHI
jgi:hypothetical protein